MPDSAKTLPLSLSATYSRPLHSSSASECTTNIDPCAAGGDHSPAYTPSFVKATTRELQYPSATKNDPSEATVTCVGAQKWSCCVRTARGGAEGGSGAA